MNLRGALAIFRNELMRAFRTIFGSILSPVLTTSLYLIVFGAAMQRAYAGPGRGRLRRVHRARAC